MKVTINNGVVTAMSETKEEALMLVSLSLGNDTHVTPQEAHETQEKRVYMVKKPCDICGEKFKGNRAMALHKALKHGIRSKNYEKNKKYWSKKNITKSEGLLGRIDTV